MPSSLSLDGATLCTSVEDEGALDISGRSGAENCFLLRHSLHSDMNMDSGSEDDHDNAYSSDLSQLDLEIRSPISKLLQDQASVELLHPLPDNVACHVPSKSNYSIFRSGPRRVLVKKEERNTRPPLANDEMNDPTVVRESHHNLSETVINPNPHSPVPTEKYNPQSGRMTPTSHTPARIHRRSLSHPGQVAHSGIFNDTSDPTSTVYALQAKKRDATLLSASMSRSPRQLQRALGSPDTSRQQTSFTRIETQENIPDARRKSIRECMQSGVHASVQAPSSSAKEPKTRTILPRNHSAGSSTARSSHLPRYSPTSPATNTSKGMTSHSSRIPILSPYRASLVKRHRTNPTTKHNSPIQDKATPEQSGTRTPLSSTGPSVISTPSSTRTSPSTPGPPSSPFSYSVASLFGKAHIQRVRTVSRNSVVSRGSVLNQNTLNSSINLSLQDNQEFVPNDTKYFKRQMHQSHEKNAIRQYTDGDKQDPMDMSTRVTSQEWERVPSASESNRHGKSDGSPTSGGSHPSTPTPGVATRPRSSKLDTIQWRYRPSGKSDPVTRRMQMLRSFERQKRSFGRSGVLSNL